MEKSYITLERLAENQVFSGLPEGAPPAEGYPAVTIPHFSKLPESLFALQPMQEPIKTDGLVTTQLEILLDGQSQAGQLNITAPGSTQIWQCRNRDLDSLPEGPLIRRGWASRSISTPILVIESPETESRLFILTVDSLGIFAFLACPNDQSGWIQDSRYRSGGNCGYKIDFTAQPQVVPLNKLGG